MQGAAVATPASGGGDPDRMRAAVAELERVRETLKEDLAERDEELAELRATIEEQKGEINGLGDALHAAEMTRAELSEHTDMLARLHTKIKTGRVADGLYDLETVLGHLDSAWGTRA